MSIFVTVVTNPELGWDCVCGVYDAMTSERDIRKEWGNDVILHVQMIQHIEPKSKLKEEIKIDVSEIPTLEFVEESTEEFWMFQDNLEIIQNNNNLLEGTNGNLNENDQKIMLTLLLEFLQKEHPNYVLIGKPCVVKDKIDGNIFFTSELIFKDDKEWEEFDDWFPYTEFNEWLLEEKGIELF